MIVDKRTEPEAVLLIDWLDAQRGHAIEILEGLSDEDLRRPIFPSGWSCLGMIGHLAGLERFWYRKVIPGDPDAPSDLPISIEWQVPAEISTEAVFASYRNEIERANAIIRETPLDAEPVWWPDFFGEWRLDSVREIILHTLTETSMHAGHLDVAREVVDGRLWLVLD